MKNVCPYTSMRRGLSRVKEKLTQPRPVNPADDPREEERGKPMRTEEVITRTLAEHHPDDLRTRVPLYIHFALVIPEYVDAVIAGVTQKIAAFDFAIFSGNMDVIATVAIVFKEQVRLHLDVLKNNEHVLGEAPHRKSLLEARTLAGFENALRFMFFFLGQVLDEFQNDHGPINHKNLQTVRERFKTTKIPLIELSKVHLGQLTDITLMSTCGDVENHMRIPLIIFNEEKQSYELTPEVAFIVGDYESLGWSPGNGPRHGCPAFITGDVAKLFDFFEQAIFDSSEAYFRTTFEAIIDGQRDRFLAWCGQHVLPIAVMVAP